MKTKLHSVHAWVKSIGYSRESGKMKALRLAKCFKMQPGGAKNMKLDAFSKRRASAGRKNVVEPTCDSDFRRG